MARNHFYKGLSEMRASPHAGKVLPVRCSQHSSMLDVKEEVAAFPGQPAPDEQRLVAFPTERCYLVRRVCTPEFYFFP